MLVRTLLALLLLDSSSAVAVPHAPTRPQSRRLHRLPVMAADGDSSSDSSVKISIKPRSAVSETAVEGGQVSVKVRPASERAAAAAADSDTDMTTTIKVTKAPQAATAPKAPEVLRSPAEEMLLKRATMLRAFWLVSWNASSTALAMYWSISMNGLMYSVPSEERASLNLQKSLTLWPHVQTYHTSFVTSCSTPW